MVEIILGSGCELFNFQFQIGPSDSLSEAKGIKELTKQSLSRHLPGEKLLVPGSKIANAYLNPWDITCMCKQYYWATLS